MQPVEMGVENEAPPEWAILERNLLDLLSNSTEKVLETYIHDDGRLRWPTDGGGLDDAYEGFSNWPLLYVLGGDENVLTAAIERWNRITEQFSPEGPGDSHVETREEFPSSLDWMHQGEGHQLFYHLCLAAPHNDQFRERAVRFAEFYAAEGGTENYDDEQKQVVAPETGSNGPTTPVNGPWGYTDWKEHYHLPFMDVDGIDRLADLKDPEKATRMGEVLAERWQGEVVTNLGVTSLVANAYLMSGEDRFREWVLEYVDAWQDRTERNDGIVPDNVGPSGEIGEYTDGRWYGGYYGWTWPHGWAFLGDALVAAVENAMLLDGVEDHLRMARSTMDALEANGVERGETVYVPYKHGDDGCFDYEPRHAVYDPLGDRNILMDEDGHVLWRDGWYEYQPMDGRHPVHLWRSSLADADKDRVDRLADQTRNVAQRIQPGSKDAAGNENAWAAYLDGEYPDYPVDILRHNHAHANDRLAKIREHGSDYEPDDDEFLNRLDPVDIEGLVHCTLGGPMPLYNGGLLQGEIRHFDPDRDRPGLPTDVAALVTDICRESLTLQLVNTGGSRRTITVQAGVYGEHVFGDATYTTTASGARETRQLSIDESSITIALPGGTETEVEFEMRRFDAEPTYEFPWNR